MYSYFADGAMCLFLQRLRLLVGYVLFPFCGRVPLALDSRGRFAALLCPFWFATHGFDPGKGSIPARV